MSTEYPGLPSLARNYWRDYIYSVVGLTSIVAFTGAFGGIIVLLIIPEAKWFFVLTAVSFIFHMAGLYVRDIWMENYEPSQIALSSASHILAVVILLGVVASTILLIGTAGGYTLHTLLDTPAIIAGAVAAYYPVLDIGFMRRGRPTPGAITFVMVMTVIDAVLNIHESVIDTLPLIGSRRKPQS